MMMRKESLCSIRAAGRIVIATATVAGITIPVGFAAAQSGPSMRVQNACIKDTTPGADPVTVRQNVAMCKCIAQGVSAAGITSQEEAELSRSFNLERAGAITDRKPGQKKLTEACMKKAYSENGRW